MTLSIKNGGGYAFLIRLDLMFSMSLWKEFRVPKVPFQFLINWNMKLENFDFRFYTEVER